MAFPSRFMVKLLMSVAPAAAYSDTLVAARLRAHALQSSLTKKALTLRQTICASSSLGLCSPHPAAGPGHSQAPPALAEQPKGLGRVGGQVRQDPWAYLQQGVWALYHPTPITINTSSVSPPAPQAQDLAGTVPCQAQCAFV